MRMIQNILSTFTNGVLSTTNDWDASKKSDWKFDSLMAEYVLTNHGHTERQQRRTQGMSVWLTLP